MQIAGIFRAKIIDVGAQTLVLEITGLGKILWDGVSSVPLRRPNSQNR